MNNMQDQTLEYSGFASDCYDNFEFGQPGDVDFYRKEALKTSGNVLELGCGTGRVLIPLAQSGVHILGLDRSKDMLKIAREHVSGIEPEAQRRIKFVKSDMRHFRLNQKFGLITIPNRSFLHLLTTDDQKAALSRVFDHLSDNGRLIFNIPNPDLESIVEENKGVENPLRKHSEFVEPTNGNTVIVWVVRDYDLTTQIVNQRYIFEEISNSGLLIKKSFSSLTLRLSYQYEIQHLLELMGFKVEALYGGFAKQPFQYGREQVWVVRK